MFSNLPTEKQRVVIDARQTEAVKIRVEADRGVLNVRVNINGKNYYFKANSMITKDAPEIMGTSLARALGLKAVNMQEAIFIDTNGKRYKGVVSPDYVENRKTTEVVNGETLIRKYLTESEFIRAGAMEYHFKALRILRNRYNFLKPEKQQLRFEDKLGLNFAKYAVFYALISNQDTNSHNFDYMIEHQKGGKKVLSLAPIFDCSYSFLMKSFRGDIYSQITSDFDDFDKLRLRDHLARIPMALQIEADENNIKTRDNLFTSLAKLIIKNKELEEFFNQAKEFDVKKFFTDLYQSKTHPSISQKDVELAYFVFQENVEHLEEHIGLQKTILNSPMAILQKKSTVNDLEL